MQSFDAYSSDAETTSAYGVPDDGDTVTDIAPTPERGVLGLQSPNVLYLESDSKHVHSGARRGRRKYAPDISYMEWSSSDEDSDIEDSDIEEPVTLKGPVYEPRFHYPRRFKLVEDDVSVSDLDLECSNKTYNEDHRAK